MKKSGAMELSVNTIVVIVLSVTMLIIGIVLVRNIMCGALGLTVDINNKVRGEITRLFGASEGEVQCIGAGGEPVQMIPGQLNFVYCGINAERTEEYVINAQVTAAPEGITETQVTQRWVKSSTWEGSVSPGDREPKKVMRLDIPNDAPEGLLTIRLTVKKVGGSATTKDLDFDVKRSGLVRAAVC